MSASAGETSIPAPVTLSVNDVDVALMWRAVQQQRYGVNDPWMFWLGVLQLLLFVPMIATYQVHHGFSTWSPLVTGLAFIAISLTKSGRSSGTNRPTYLIFDADGLTVEFAFSPPSGNRYEWRWIQRIDEVGDSFVIVPRHDKRIVLPKRAFPDHGHEAWAFFAAHGVAGRVPPLQPAVA